MLAIIDYGSGNLRSVAKAFEHVGGKILVTSQANDLKKASHIVLPGVGAYGDCMRGLQALDGMIDTMQEQVTARKKLFLGICVGMQMLFERGHEHGMHQGLGWLKGEVIGIRNSGSLKIPHMGWNELAIQHDHPLLAGIANEAHAYFVHSYHAQCADKSEVLATSTYGQTIAAVVGREHILGTQFHPEKSQETGLKLLGNFLKL